MDKHVVLLRFINKRKRNITDIIARTLLPTPSLRQDRWSDCNNNYCVRH